MMEFRRNKRSGCQADEGGQMKKRNFIADYELFISDSNSIKRNLKAIDKALRETVSFDFIKQIIHPTLLTKTSGLSVFEINLGIDTANYISLGRDRLLTNSSKDLTNNYVYNTKMLIRICKIEDDIYSLDEHPEHITIKVNNIAVNLMKNCLIDVTDYLKINPSIKNTIKIFNEQTKSKTFYIVSVFLARKAEVNAIVKRLLAKSIRSEEYTKNKIKNILRKEQHELEFTSIEVPLKCPLSQTVMTNPCQSYECIHLDCFETEHYLQLNEDSEKWLCPICKIYAPPQNLVIDGYLLQTLKVIPEGCSSLILNTDGTCILGS